MALPESGHLAHEPGLLHYPEQTVVTVQVEVTYLLLPGLESLNKGEENGPLLYTMLRYREYSAPDREGLRDRIGVAIALGTEREKRTENQAEVSQLELEVVVRPESGEATEWQATIRQPNW